MIKPGDVIVIDFVGVRGVKRRPAVVVSSDLYHQHRPDVITGLITSQIAKATAPTDYLIRDWPTAGLVIPSAFRAYLYTALRTSIVATIGRVTDHDWQGILSCMQQAIAS